MVHFITDPAGEEEDSKNSSMQERSSLKMYGSEEEEDDPVASQAGPLLGEEGYHDHSVSSSKLGSGSPVFSSRVGRLLRERQLRRGESGAGDIDGIGGSEGIIKDEQRQRLLVVANRLPVSAIRRSENAWALELSAGGLVSALLGVKQFETTWIGWAGVNVQDDVGKESLSRALGEEGFVPVFLDEQTVDLYYNGYCNNVLWPLFHYIGLTQDDRLAATRGLEAQFNAYKRANSIFAQVVLSHYQKGDVVWCHDYHLMFLPRFLKEAKSEMKVGWFLHTPFPSSEIYRTLPQRSELLQAVLKADLIGFHTYDYARHFVSACTRILGLEGTPDGVEDQGKLTRVAAFPIGIDAERFVRALHTSTVRNHIQELSRRFSGRKVMLGVDRLDMIKGIPQKLLAFEKFLEDNPIWHDKVVMVQIAVPTRTDVHEYQKLSSQVHEIVGRINGRFGTLTTVPIHHLDRSLEFCELCALYAITDVLLVTSLRDGMNLVSYEYVACQDQKKGVLVLSEFAGAAQSLGAGAILINPWNIVEAACAIADALNMSETERQERHRHNFIHVTSHTAQLWADTFVSELNDTVVEAELRILRVPPPLPVEKAISSYATSKNCLLILGFNAALTAQADAPRLDRVRETLHPALHETLRHLCADPKATVVILSGSERSLLDEAFGDFKLWLAAENGMFLRHTSGDWMTTMPEHLNLDWVESVQLVFDYFSERTPRSYVEARQTSLVWNFKYADLEFGRVQAWDMLQHLWTGPISNAAVDVVQGSKSVEVRPVGVSKGAAIDRILGEVVHSKNMSVPIDYVMCIGHFLSKDEDIYTFFEPDLPYQRVNIEPKAASPPRSKAAPSTTKAARSPDHPIAPQESSMIQGASVLDLNGENYFSCTVGRQRSLARYSLAGSEEVVAFLSSLAKPSN
ncbi:alpha,alpha-trehalose-phosphate synthase [UDP-forming] 1-like [Selaginella moellendorffii]|uniref:alpha,alpha-trehalose-phosphate synthase [UDP-forming] 1-like n=1 Tax=Selaginella moellendorffii TaxID=88036 RepID=UPI000D1C2FBC|nr:alpha,alpha-trehalose-phosphate synthase [UDP-forming] 1-like [Selaginella moellendorffii]|eukprot:XP_024539145.1 alpha,alpha-trehalose-phosphate synthase [UDP-forming] 1-like [Selaginella moellendorffii]